MASPEKILDWTEQDIRAARELLRRLELNVATSDVLLAALLISLQRIDSTIGQR